MGRPGLRRLLRQGAGRHAEGDRRVLVPRRGDARRLRGPRGGAAPLLPHRGQADRRPGRRRGAVPGVAAGSRLRRVDGAGLWHGGRRVPRVHRQAGRAGRAGCRGHRRVRGHPGRLPGQDGGAQTVRRAVVAAVRRRRRAGRRRGAGGGPGGEVDQTGQDPVGMGPGRRGQDPAGGRPRQPVRQTRLRDHLADHPARAARHRRQTAAVRRSRLARQPAVGGAGQDRPPGAAAAAQGRRLGDHRLHPSRPPGERLPAGVRPAHRPDRPVLRPGPPAPDPGQARPGRARAAGRATPPRHALAAAHAGDPAAGRRHAGRADRRHPRPPVGRVHRRVPEIVAAVVGAVRPGPGRAGVGGDTMSAASRCPTRSRPWWPRSAPSATKYHAEAAGAGPVRGVQPQRVPRVGHAHRGVGAGVDRRGAAARSRPRPCRAWPRRSGSWPAGWAGAAWRPTCCPGRVAQARPVRPAHLHRPATGGAVRADRPLPLLRRGSAAAPGHAGAVPHDLRLRAALLGGPAAARRRRRHRHRRAADPRRERRQGPAGARLRAARDRLAGYHAQVAGQPDRREWFFPGSQAGRAADARQRRPQLPPVPLAGAASPTAGRGHGPRVHDLRHYLCGQQPAVLVRRRARRRRAAAGAADLPGPLVHRRHRLLPAPDRRVLPGHHRPRAAGHRRRRAARHGRTALMATDFAVFLRRFLTGHLAGLRGYSPNTIASYRDAFKLLICYFRDERSLPPEQAHPRADRRRRHHRVPRLAAHQPAQQRLDQQPAAGRDRLVLHLDADPGPGPHGLLPGHPRDPRQQARPAGRGPPDRRADPPSARPTRPVHPQRPTRRDPAGHPLRHRRQGPRTRRPDRARHPPGSPRHGRADRQGPQDPSRPARRQHHGAADRLPRRAATRQPRPRRPPGVLQPAPSQTQPRRDRLDPSQIPGPGSRSGARQRPPQPTRPAAQPGHAPLRQRRSAALHPRHPRPRRPVHHRDLRARLHRGQTQSPRSRLRPTSSPPTWPNGTRTPSCSTGSPASDRVRVMRSVRPPPRPPTSGNRRALRITQRCS